MKRIKKVLKKILIGCLIGLATSVSLILFTNRILEDFWNDIEKKTYDLRYRMRFIYGAEKSAALDEEGKSVAVAKINDDILVINIDERSFKKLGVYFKWPRYYFGEALEHMASGNNAVSTFDILFDKPDYGETWTKRIMDIIDTVGIINTSSGLKKDNLKRIINKGVDFDRMFENSTRKAGNVIHACLFTREEEYENKSDWQERSTEEWRGLIQPLTSSAKLSHDITSHFEEKPILDGVYPGLAQAAQRVAYVNVAPDVDGIHRSVPILLNFRGYTYPSLALQTSLTLFGRNIGEIEIKPGEYINIGAPFRIIRDSSGFLKTSYPGVYWQMIKHLIDKKESILKLENNQEIEICESVKIVNDQEGLWADILAGPISQTSLEDIMSQKPAFYQTLELGKKYRLGKNTAMELTDTDELAIFENASNPDEEEEISEIPLSTILTLAACTQEKINSIKKETSLILTNRLTVKKTVEGLRTEYLTLRQETLSELLNTSPGAMESLKKNKEIPFGREVKIPVDKDGRMLINFQGGKRNYKYVSIYDVKNKRIPAEYFCGKPCILGSDAAALFDIVASPFENEYPGVEIHATLVDNIVNNNFLKKLSDSRAILIIIALSVLIGVMTYVFKLGWAFLILFISVIAYLVLSVQYFNKEIWIPLVIPVLSMFFSYLIVTIVRYITEEKDKKFLHNTFKNYLSPDLIDMMYENKQQPQLGGEEGIRTAYFTDIQSFSTFSEVLGSPSKLVELLNEYLTAMTDTLIEHQGTLDKYEGDAIIAFFGAPMPLPDHAAKACLTALAMQEKLLDLRKKWTAEGNKWPQIVKNMHMRIGINSGPLVTGNMGSQMRMNYTMMGDTVNLAARLESGAKQYGVFSMCSEETLKLTGENVIQTRQIDVVRVVGKSEPVKIYELLGRHGQISGEAGELVETFEEAYKWYIKQEWDKALNLFRESSRLEPFREEPGVKTTPSKVFIGRCENYKETPPDKDWDGVFTATEK
ncbi:MAG: CHASE2 domain-containing protein [bacterium]